MPLEAASISPPVPRKHVLFLSMYHLGWKTLAAQLETQAKAQTRLEILCVRVVAPFWLRLLLWQWPKPLNRSLVRLATGWRWYIGRKYRNLVLNGKFDVIYVNSQVLALGLLDLCRQAHFKLAVSLDVTGAAHTRDLRKLTIAPGELWPEETSIYREAQLIVPMSRWIADSLVDDLGVAREKIMVMPPAVNIRDFSGANLPCPSGRLPRILFCGNDWQRKGGARLVRWHQEHWADLAELHLLSAKATVPDGLKNVVVHGQVSHDRWLHEILPSAQIFCLPTWEDMSPYALSEAQAAGLPVVTSRIGGIPELVLHGQTGFVLPPEDEPGFIAAVSRLLKDETLRLAMGRAAREHARVDLDADTLFQRLFSRLADDPLEVAA